ncbi:NAD/NADP octopine/nopaline dehydrogenase family protein [Clostridium oceanicum]|uniref:NAD/NADP octopine/nopaline dehydrogenase family protein n=1 Tax=Clostridium oceanicum TaxID=1543 RepID=A0ABP3UL25_9CLOT
METKKTLNWAIIGAGNGGQSMAGHLGIMGHPVKIYDVSQKTVDAINEKGGIEVDGAIEGFGKVKMASTNIKEVIDGVDMIIVVLPSLYHASIAKACAPYLKDGQTILLHPNATCGALEFRKVLDDENCKAKVTLAETQTLVYVCRAAKPGHAHIYGLKNVVLTAALPSSENKRVLKELNTVFPQFKEAENVLITSLENINAMLHPAPTILNAGRIDSQEDWLYYYDGFTPAIGHFVEEMDKERLEVGKALGLKLKPMMEWFDVMYDAHGENFSDAVKDNKSYDGVKGQKTLYTRYLLEDIPNSLVPIVSLGKKLNVNVTKMETIVNLVKGVLGDKLSSKGRTVETLGLEDCSKEELLEYVKKGA